MIYTIIIESILLLLVLSHIISTLRTFLFRRQQYFILEYLLHPLSHKWLASLFSSPLHVQSLSDAGIRAAHLSLSNLILMYLSGGYKLGAYLLGVSRETYSTIHRTIGVMAVLQAIIHVVIAVRTHKISTSNSLHVYGILHTHALTDRYTCLYLLCYLVIFVTSSVWQFACILFQNMAPGRKPTELIVDIQGENVLRVTLSPSRPWRIRAGQWIELNVPHWQDNGTGRAASIFLLIQQQSGFMKKLAHCIKPSQVYRAWIDGPYGPTAVGAGRASEAMGDYGHILMVATEGHRKKDIRTRRISIIWQLDEEGDWEGAHDWLQTLLKEDEGYLLSVTVYDTLHPVLTGNPRRFGHQDLIEVYSGVLICREQLSSEMDKQAGRMLVAGVSPT
ncbi:hypothetical protein BDV10DRAFT_193875 [Aspergillus recurvatus]